MSRELFLAAVLLAAVPALAESGGGPATATMPLYELLRLRESAEPQKAAAPKPPIAASIDEVAISGRLLAEAFQGTAQVKVSVLGEGWVRVPLLRLDAQTHLQSAAAGEGSVVAAEGDLLTLITSGPGQRTVELSLTKDAVREGARRTLELPVERSAVAVLRARFDPDLVRLPALATTSGDELLAYPERGSFRLSWELRAVSPQPVAQAQSTRPPVEPVITAAHASVICTLDGLELTRLLYELRLQGPQVLELTIPKGVQVRKAYLNGSAVAFDVKGASLRFPVAPRSAGEDTARLELGLAGERREFHLSGTLALALPSAGWRINQLLVTVHLPHVFNYVWSGGSVAPAEVAPEPEFQQAMPTPGKVLGFRQELITAAPDLRLEYAVDLDKRYFRADAAWRSYQPAARE